MNTIFIFYNILYLSPYRLISLTITGDKSLSLGRSHLHTLYAAPSAILPTDELQYDIHFFFGFLFV